MKTKNKIGSESNQQQFFNGSLFKKMMNKPKRLATIVMAVGTAVIMTGCNSPAQNVDDAEKDVLQAEQSLEKANADYRAEIKNYRKETNDRIKSNNHRINKLKSRAERNEVEGKAERRQRISELEKKNTEMKKRMDNYQEDTRENWEKFKADFNHEMDELGSSLEDLVSDNN